MASDAQRETAQVLARQQGKTQMNVWEETFIRTVDDVWAGNQENVGTLGDSHPRLVQLTRDLFNWSIALDRRVAQRAQLANDRCSEAAVRVAAAHIRLQLGMPGSVDELETLAKEAISHSRRSG